MEAERTAVVWAAEAAAGSSPNRWAASVTELEGLVAAESRTSRRGGYQLTQGEASTMGPARVAIRERSGQTPGVGSPAGELEQELGSWRPPEAVPARATGQARRRS